MDNYRILAAGKFYWCKNQNGFKQALIHGFCGNHIPGRGYEWQEIQKYMGTNYPNTYPCYILIDQARFEACGGRDWKILYPKELDIKPQNNNFPIIQQQKWKNYTRFLIVIEGASAQLELYHKTAWFGGTAFLYALWTDPEYRKKGKAKELMNLAENTASKLGHNALFLECNQENDPFVLEWYHRIGYKDKGCPRGMYLLKKILK